MPEWLAALIADTKKQAPAAVVFAIGMYAIASKIDTLSHAVIEVMTEQKTTIRDAMSVIGETKEVIRNNTIIASDSAQARRELAQAIDRQKDFMLYLVQQQKLDKGD